MRKIAIIKQEVSYYDDHHQKILESITDWEEVSEEDYQLLRRASTRMNFAILEQPTEIKPFIAATIETYKKLAKADQDRIEADRKKREEKAAERQLKKELKTTKNKVALFEKLKAELGKE